MKIEDLRNLNDNELALLTSAAEKERTVRAEKLRADTMAQIKTLAEIAGLSVSFGGKRGRPRKATAVAHTRRPRAE